MHILGATLNTLPPESHAHVPMEDIVTVLYGRNGAGKSQILDRLSSIFSGSESVMGAADEAMTLVFTSEGIPQTLMGGWHPWLLADMMHIRLDDEMQGSSFVSAMLPQDHSRSELSLSDQVDLLIGETMDYWMDIMYWEDQRLSPEAVHEGDLLEQILRECLRRPTFSFARNLSGEFTVFLSVVPDEAGPTTAGLLRDTDRAWGELLAGHATALGSNSQLVRAATDGACVAPAKPTVGKLAWAPSDTVLGFGAAPSWVPRPLLGLPATKSVGIGLQRDAPSMSELAQRTEEVLLQRRGFASAATWLDYRLWGNRPATSLFDAEGNFDPEVEDILTELSADADRRFGLIFSGNHRPRLAARTAQSPLEFRKWGPFGWRAQTAGGEVPLDALSSAEMRWAAMAIGRAIDGPTAGRVRLTILDEPEMALHPEAQRRLSEALPAMGTRVLVSTHSPSLLDAHNNLVHVWREGGSTRTAALELSTRLEEVWQLADSLGVLPSELLQLTRILILVEGPHDEAVLGSLLKDEMSEVRAHMITLEGTKDLEHIAATKWLIRLSNAQILALFDDVPKNLRLAWEETHRRLRTSNNNERGPLLEVRRKSGGHRRKIAELGLEALEQGSFSRIHLTGIDEKDIANLLPISAFLPDAASWKDAYKQCLSQTGGRADGETFKRWVNKRSQGRYTIRGLREVSEMVANGDLTLPPSSRRQLEVIASKLRELAGV